MARKKMLVFSDLAKWIATGQYHSIGVHAHHICLFLYQLHLDPYLYVTQKLDSHLWLEFD